MGEPDAMPAISRRNLIGMAIAGSFGASLAGATSEPGRPFAPASAPSGAVEHMIDVGGAQLWCWDSGGSGEAVLLVHPATGSAAIWEHQYPPFVAADYRVIAYSRRGHYRSSTAPSADPGYSADDLHRVADSLGLDRFHLLGSAAGGFVVPDYALLHPERVLSLILACTQGGGADPDYREAIRRILPPGFAEMPASFRELGPSYRATNPEGVARWEALEHIATPGGRLRQRRRHVLDWPTLSRISVPTLVIAADADLYIPPALARIYASRIRGSRFEVIRDSGHSAYWEQPDAFNRLVLDFISAHRR